MSRGHRHDENATTGARSQSDVLDTAASVDSKAATPHIDVASDAPQPTQPNIDTAAAQRGPAITPRAATLPPHLRAEVPSLSPRRAAQTTGRHRVRAPLPPLTPDPALDVRTSQALATVTARMRPSTRSIAEVPADEIGFVLELARALHRYGTPAHRLEEAVSVVCQRMNLAVEVFSTPTSIILSFGNPSDLRTRLLRVETGELDMSKLAAVDELADAVVDHEMSAAEGIQRLAEIMGRPPRYSLPVTLIASGVSAGGLAVFFSGGWREVLCASVLSMVLHVLGLLVHRSVERARMFEVLGAGLAAFWAASAAHLFPHVSPSIVTISGMLGLLPGMSLTIAMTELATKNLISGTARLMSAVIVLLELTVGVALGDKIAHALFTVPRGKPIPLPSWTTWVALAASAVAVAIVARARLRVFAWIVTACAVGYVGAKQGTRWLGPELGVLVGAFGLGCLANLYARVFDRPAQVVLVPAMLLLVPGSLGFRGMSSLLARNTVTGVETMFAMFIAAMALVAGLLLANAALSPRRVL